MGSFVRDLRKMNWRDNFVRLATILVLVWGFEIIISWGMGFFIKPTPQQQVTEVKSGERITTLAAAEIREPLRFDVDFVDSPTEAKEQQIAVTSNQATLGLTTNGATIDRYKSLRCGEKSLVTLTPSASSERVQRLFMVGLDAMTPFFYRLVENRVDGDRTIVRFEGESPVARITKTFTIAQKTSQVDLALTIEPLGQAEPIRPRIFVTGPQLVMGWQDPVGGLVLNESGKIEKVVAKNIAKTAWVSPGVFGVQDRYFVHALVKDQNHFARRGYFMARDGERVTAIIEGPIVKEKTTWTLSFYCGPKEEQSLNAVDARLESLLEYGWFSWLTKLMLHLLEFLNRYLHNYGLAILAISLVLNLAMVPLNIHSQKGMEKHKEFSRKMKHIEQRFADDKERLQVEKLELIKKYGMFPGMGMGCLPIFVQIPIFAGLASALRSSIELYQAPFLLWITDLSGPDTYYILPILTVICTYFSMKTPQSGGAVQNVTMIIMMFFVGYMMLKLSAGLVLYVLVGTVVRLVQMRFLNFKKA